MTEKTITTKAIILFLLMLMTGCKEDKCAYDVTDSKRFTAAFDHCMDKAAEIAKGGTHDNSYDTVSECKSFAMQIDTAQCKEAEETR